MNKFFGMIGSRLHVCSLLGIPICLHSTWIGMVLLMIFMPLVVGGGIVTSLALVIAMLVTFVIVTLHELGHCLAARRLGRPVQDITLFAVGGLARIEMRAMTPTQELLIALAGPAVNVLLLAVLLPLPDFPLRAFLVNVNLVLAVFNMLPIFPMDGGRVARALLSYVRHKDDATYIVVRSGQVLSLILGVASIWFGQYVMPVVLLLMSLFANNELAAIQAQKILEGIRIKIAVVLDRPELLSADSHQLADALDAVADREIRAILKADDLTLCLRNVPKSVLQTQTPVYNAARAESTSKTTDPGGEQHGETKAEAL